MFDFSIVTHWIDNLLRSVMPGWGALLVEFVLVGVVLLLLYAVLALFYIYILSVRSVPFSNAVWVRIV